MQSLPQADSPTAGQRVIHIWLGDKGTDDGARVAWDGDNGMKQKYAPVLDNYALEVRQFVGGTTIYRIYAGPIESLEKAQELCTEIKRRNGSQMCRPVIN